jgi:glycosidase
MGSNWLHNAVIYQIFPERFHIGRGLSVELKQQQGFYTKPGDVVRRWNETPSRGPEQNRHFWGGDLEGIREKLPYLEELGITVLYLTPFYPSPSNHKYDAVDYCSIDPAFGTIDDFRRLVDGVHSRGMRIIIDIALNHMSDQHPYFTEACGNPDSPYREYFIFDEYPGRYRSWYGHKHMPELNYANPAVVEEFISGPDSVPAFWLKLGVDGFRLDTANDLGIPLLRIIEAAVKRINPDAVVVGEVSQYPGEWTDALDGVQSYYFRHGLIALSLKQTGLPAFRSVLCDLVEKIPYPLHLGLFNQVGSHDAPRLLTTLQKNPKMYSIFLAMLFAFPGVPMIYYGEENGMEGDWDPCNRAPMCWDPAKWNKGIRELFKRWTGLRKERAELRTGRTILLDAAGASGLIAFIRHTEEPHQFSFALMNPGKKRVRCKLFVNYAHAHSQMMLEDVFSGYRSAVRAGAIEIDIAPFQAMLLLPDIHTKQGFSFYKSWHSPGSMEYIANSDKEGKTCSD